MKRFFLPPGFSSSGLHSFQAPEKPCFNVLGQIRLYEAGVHLEKADLPKTQTAEMQTYPSLPWTQREDYWFHFCYSLQAILLGHIKEMHVTGWGELCILQVERGSYPE